MRCALRPFLALVLAAILALTGVTSAIAHGQGPAAGQAVLCTTAGERIVTLDARGTPIIPAQPCPDCTLTLATAPGSAPRPGPPDALVPLTQPTGRSVHAAAQPHHPIRARAPPSPV